MSCLEETIAHYIASLLTYTKAITDPFLKRMETDREQLFDFFEKSCAKERVRLLPFSKGQLLSFQVIHSGLSFIAQAEAGRGLSLNRPLYLPCSTGLY